jgi:cell division protein FtsA
MNNQTPTLFIEINNLNYIFAAGKKNEQNEFKIVYECIAPLEGIENNIIKDFDFVLGVIKKNIYLIEQKLNFTFLDTVLILNNFNCSFVNLSGFKKLNGSQILKENITYILNSLKTNVNETENKKTIIHIFNSKYNLDKRSLDNLPIGLFGDFYNHELSFCLINNNDFKNIKNILNKCNLKIKKILFKSFAEGSLISNQNENITTFYKIKISDKSSQIFYFENDSLKFEQNFNFGSDLLLKDISKITSIDINTIKKIIDKIELTKDLSDDELIEKEFFETKNYVQIKKKLICNIIEARIQELSEIILTKNINLQSFNKKEKVIFTEITNELHFKSFKEIFKSFLSKNGVFEIRFIEKTSTENLMNNVNQIVQYGWKKEAIPVAFAKKSLIAKFFDLIFA